MLFNGSIARLEDFVERGVRSFFRTSDGYEGRRPGEVEGLVVGPFGSARWVCRRRAPRNHSILQRVHSELEDRWRTECVWGWGYAILRAGGWMNLRGCRPPRMRPGKDGDLRLGKPTF